MKRFHLFELHDFSWFPSELRCLVLQFLVFAWCPEFPNWVPAWRWLLSWWSEGPVSEEKIVNERPVDLVVKKLVDMMDATQNTTIIDLCSGAGGPLVTLAKILRQSHHILKFYLTDLHPCVNQFEQIKRSCDNIHYCSHSLNALHLQRHLLNDSVDPTTSTQSSHSNTGNIAKNGMEMIAHGHVIRTLFMSFHHFNEDQATQLLRDAIKDDDSIAIFELTNRTWHQILRYLFLFPIMIIYRALAIRTFSWKRFLFTFIIPLIPFVLLLDGVISHMRSYTEEEMYQMTQEVDPTHQYHWEISQDWTQLFPIHLGTIGSWLFSVPVVSLIGVPHHYHIALKGSKRLGYWM